MPAALNSYSRTPTTSLFPDSPAKRCIPIPCIEERKSLTRGSSVALEASFTEDVSQTGALLWLIGLPENISSISILESNTRLMESRASVAFVTLRLNKAIFSLSIPGIMEMNLSPRTPRSLMTSTIEADFGSLDSILETMLRSFAYLLYRIISSLIVFSDSGLSRILDSKLESIHSRLELTSFSILPRAFLAILIFRSIDFLFPYAVSRADWEDDWAFAVFITLAMADSKLSTPDDSRIDLAISANPESETTSSDVSAYSRLRRSM